MKPITSVFSRCLSFWQKLQAHPFFYFGPLGSPGKKMGAPGVLLCTISGLLVLDILSWFFFGTRWEGVVTVLLLILIAGGAWRMPGLFFLAAVAEVISTSHGHALHLAIGGIAPSLRMVLFGLALLEGLWHNRVSIMQTMNKRETLPMIWLGVGAGIFAMSVFVARVNGIPFADIARDGSGYMAWGYVAIAWLWRKHDELWKLVWQVATASAVYVALKTIALFFAFAHFSPVFLDAVYHWVRDTRLGEPTRQFGSAYRIFLPAQWFLVPWILFAFAREATQNSSRRERVLGMIVIAAVLISLSRTFWLAGGLAGMALMTVQARFLPWKKTFARLGQWLAMGIGAIGIVWILFALPLSMGDLGRGNTFQSFFAKRFTPPDADAALDSRQRLRPVLEAAIAKHPFLGNGLGTRITYATRDPRYIDMHGTDQVSPLRVEWGWHDIWVKFGLLGLLWFTATFAWCLLQLWKRRLTNPLALPAAATLIALAVAHMFSPYLNHPIGALTVALALFIVVEKHPSYAR